MVFFYFRDFRVVFGVIEVIFGVIWVRFEFYIGGGV